MFWIKKKKKRKPMTRNIYLMERNGSSLRWFLAFFFKARIIKIGVAKDSRQREKQVNSGIKGDVVFLTEYEVESATRTEAHIHKLYKSDSFRPKVYKRGSGESEFFKLSNRQINEIKSILSSRSKSNSNFRKVFFFICFVILLFYYFLNFSK